MYSFEIKQLLEFKKYLLTNQEYLEIFNPEVSTQIDTIIYNPWDKYFAVWTKDNNYFQFKVDNPTITDNVIVPCENSFNIKRRSN